MNMDLPLTRRTLKDYPVDFRIGAIISDGMWYSQTKWRRLAKVSEEEINKWIKQHLEDGSLIQSPTGAKSYRFSLDAIRRWYNENNIPIGTQLIDSIFPPRIWDEMTETEGFLNAPLREIGVVSFSCNDALADIIKTQLLGTAKVRESEPGRYKAYCLYSPYVKLIIEKIFKDHNYEPERKTYSRGEAKRREIVDFTPKFAEGLTMFYKDFGRSLVKGGMETIKMFLPEQEDQDSQVTFWVLEAIEKFDESKSVPFSGYLNSVLSRWPYNLPVEHLGKELSEFQRGRSKAIKSLKNKYGVIDNISAEEIAEEMDIEVPDFKDFDEKHNIWKRFKNATTLTWDNKSEEKLSTDNVSGNLNRGQSYSDKDIQLANKLSVAIIDAALNSELYDDAYTIIEQMDVSEINFSKIDNLSDDFIQELGYSMGM